MSYKWPYIVANGTKVFLKRPTIAEPKEWEGKPTTRIRRGKEMASTYVDLGDEHASIRKQKVKHWINKVGILGIGDGVLDAMVAGDTPLVSSPADLYRLTADQLATLRIGANGNVLGQSNARKIINQINTNRKLPLPKFLGALGVDLLGSRRAEIIAKEQGLNDLNDWLNPSKLQLIPGDTIRQSITTGLQAVRHVIDDLLSVGVEVESVKSIVDLPKPSNGLNLTGFSFCFTGIRLPEAEAKIVAAGGTIKTGVSKFLTHLVQKDPTSQSTKTQKADELGVKVISVATLEAVLDGRKTLS